MPSEKATELPQENEVQKEIAALSDVQEKNEDAEPKLQSENTLGAHEAVKTDDDDGRSDAQESGNGARSNLGQ